MRGRTGLAPLLGFILWIWGGVGIVAPPEATAQTPQPTPTVFFTLQQGDFSATLVPLKNPQDVVQFYNYANFQSNTGLEQVGRSLLFFYEDTTTGTLSLVILHGRADASPGSATFAFDGLPQGVQFLVQDDPDDVWSLTPPTAQVNWTWQPGYGDGLALGPLPESFQITITPQFGAGILEFAALSGELQNPETILLPSLTAPITLTAQFGVPPVADFTFSPETPGVGVSVTFDARASRPSPGRAIVRYEWDFNGDGIFEVSTASPTIEHTFTEVGEFPVTLKVVDDQGITATVTKTVRIVEVSVRAIRRISTPEAAPGFTFRVTIEIEAGLPVNGLGLDEDLPPGFEVTPIDTGGATFKRAETQFVWAETIQANEIRRVVYDVTVRPEAALGPLPRIFEITGTLESASPAFLTTVSGESEIALVDCLSIPVAISHLTLQDVVNLRLDEYITADQLQRAFSYWLEDAGVPATCDAQLTFETMKQLVARQLQGIPVDEEIPEQPGQGAVVVRSILTPLPFSQVYLPGDTAGRVFTVKLEIEALTDLAGFGVREIFPVRWEIKAVDSGGAVFKRPTREWVFSEKLTAGQRRTIVYEVTVPAEDTSTGTVRFQGSSQSVIPSFEALTGGDTEVQLVECLSVPVAIAHLDTVENDIDVTLSNLIQFDQIQAAIAFWLEDVDVPGTCGRMIDFDMIKTLIAHWLTDTPVDRPLPGAAAPPN